MAKAKMNVFQIIKQWSITIFMLLILVAQNLLPKPGQIGYDAEVQNTMIWYIVMAIAYFWLGFALLERIMNERYQKKFGGDWILDCEVYTTKTRKIDFYHQVKDMDLLAVSQLDLERILESDLYQICLERVIIEQSVKRIEKRLEPLNISSTNSTLTDIAKKLNKTELTEEFVRLEIEKTRKDLNRLQGNKDRIDKTQKSLEDLQEKNEMIKQVNSLDMEIAKKRDALAKLQTKFTNPSKKEAQTPEETQKMALALQTELDGLQKTRGKIIADLDLENESDKAKCFIYLAQLSQDDEFEKKDIPKDLLDPFTGSKVTGKFGFILMILPLPWFNAFNFTQGTIRVQGYEINVKKTKCTFARADYLMENIPVYKCTYCTAMNDAQVDEIVSAQGIVDYEKMALAKIICEQKGDMTQGNRLLAAFAGEADYLKRQGDTILRMYQEDIRPTTPTAALLFKQFGDRQAQHKQKRSYGWVIVLIIAMAVLLVLGGVFFW